MVMWICFAQSFISTFVISNFIFVFAKSLVEACCLDCLQIAINRTVADGDVDLSQLFCPMAKRTFDIGVIDCPPFLQRALSWSVVWIVCKLLRGWW